MKKRYFLSLIFALVVVFSLDKYWLIQNPLRVDFVIEGKGNPNIAVDINRKDNDDFVKIRSAGHFVKINGKEKVSFNIKQVKRAKRLRIRVSGLAGGGAVSQIGLQKDKYKLDKLHSFTIKDGRKIIKGDKILFYPDEDSVILTYQEPLNIKTDVKFDRLVFIIITVLSFLLFYKLSSYLIDFKEIKGVSRIDLFFVLAFFVILFIPMLKIDTMSVYSSADYRKLAVYKPFCHKEINYNFGKDFDNWFSDRFYLRKEIISSYMKFRYMIAVNFYENSNGYVNKNNNWFQIKYQAKCSKYLSKQELDEYLYSISELMKFCSKNNIKLYVVAAPSKKLIYPEKTYPYLNNNNNEYLDAMQVKKYLKDKLNFNVIYPYDEIMDGKKDEYMFFKTDHHWTEPGAFAAYKVLMNEIKKDFSAIHICKENEFDYFYDNLVRANIDRDFSKGQTYSMVMGFDNEKDVKNKLNVKYKYYKHKDYNNLTTKLDKSDNIDAIALRNSRYNIKAPRAVLFGDSFGDNLMEVLQFSFHTTDRIYTFTNSPEDVKYRFDMRNRFENRILSYKPDILIVCFTDSGIERINYLYQKEDK